MLDSPFSAGDCSVILQSTMSKSTPQNCYRTKLEEIFPISKHFLMELKEAAFQQAYSK